MAEELKINVTVAGAAKAQGDLAAVAAAETKVAASAAAAGGAAKDAGKQTGAAAAGPEKLGKEMFGAHRQSMAFRQMLSALPPELGHVVHMLEWTAMATTGVGVAMGVGALAIAGITALFNALSEAEKKAAEQAAKVADALAAQRDKYLAVADAVSQARSESEQAYGEASKRPTKDIVAQAERAALGTDLSAEGRSRMAQAMATTAVEVTDQEAGPFARWLAAGLDKGITDAHDRLAAFRAELAGDAALAGRLEQAMAERRRLSPETFGRAAQEARIEAAGIKPAAAAAGIIKGIAEESVTRGTMNPLTEQQIRDLLGEVYREQEDARLGERAGTVQGGYPASQRLRALIREFPAAAGLHVRQGQGVGYDEPAAGDAGAGQAREPFSWRAMFQGGTHFHYGDNRDPAGAASRQAGY